MAVLNPFSSKLLIEKFRSADIVGLKEIGEKFKSPFIHHIMTEEGPLPMLIHVLKSDITLQKKLMVIEFLLNHNANANSVDHHKNTALHLLAEKYLTLALQAIDPDKPLDEDYFKHLEKCHSEEINFIKTALNLFLHHGAFLHHKNKDDFDAFAIIRGDHLNEQAGPNDKKLTQTETNQRWEIYKKFCQYCEDTLTNAVKLLLSERNQPNHIPTNSRV